MVCKEGSRLLLPPRTDDKIPNTVALDLLQKRAGGGDDGRGVECLELWMD